MIMDFPITIELEEELTEGGIRYHTINLAEVESIETQGSAALIYFKSGRVTRVTSSSTAIQHKILDARTSHGYWIAKYSR